MVAELTREDALHHYFHTLGLCGHEIVFGKEEKMDWAKIYLMEVAGRGTSDPMDKLFAEMLLFEVGTRMDFEQARIRHTRPLLTTDHN